MERPRDDRVTDREILLWVAELRQEIALERQNGAWTKQELLTLRARFWAVLLLLAAELALPVLRQFFLP